MIQEDKQLLLKDLSARLPFGVKVQCITKSARIANASSLIETLDTVLYRYVEEDNIELKPYLRSLSSMTEDDKREFDRFVCIDEDAWLGKENGCINQAKIMSGGVDWLNANHFDYRGLIPKDLAIEAPKDMYKTE